MPEIEENTEQRKFKIRRWANLSYTRRMTLSFAMIAAMTALVATMLLSLVWEQHFQSYTRENMETTATVTANHIAEKLSEGGVWDSDTISMAEAVHLTYPDLGILVIDRFGSVRYDSSKEDASSVSSSGTGVSGSSIGSGSGGASDSSSSSTNAGNATSGSAGSASSTVNSQMAMAPIMVHGQAVGTVRVWVYGSDSLLRQSDIEFRSNSYQTMLIAAIVAIVLACIIGYVFARNLVSPITRLTSTATAIKEGDLSARTGLTGEDEIAHLGETFDEMAEAVEQEQAHERRLTTDVAHELRTPLMALQATTEAMIDGVFEPDQERLGVVNSEVQRLSRMVNALLELSRLENRATPITKELVNVGEVVEQVVASHEIFVTDNGLELTFATEPDVYVMGNADMIRQATANLISNAVRYTPEGGSIHVEVRSGEIMSSVIVQDTGIGLTPEEAKQVFNRFWRADAGRQRESGGLGIGLAVVKEIVDRHGGWVQVEGKKNVGARFTLHFPLYDEEKERAARREAAKKAQRNQKMYERQQQQQQRQQEQLEKQLQRQQQKMRKRQFNGRMQVVPMESEASRTIVEVPESPEDIEQIESCEPVIRD